MPKVRKSVPLEIKGDKIAESKYREIFALVKDPDPLDVGTIAMLAKAYSKYWAVNQRLDLEGEITISDRGQEQVNPLVRVKKMAFDQYTQSMKTLGLVVQTATGKRVREKNTPNADTDAKQRVLRKAPRPNTKTAS